MFSNRIPSLACSKISCTEYLLMSKATSRSRWVAFNQCSMFIRLNNKISLTSSSHEAGEKTLKREYTFKFHEVK